MQQPTIYGTGEKVILSVEDDSAAYLLLKMGFEEVGGDFRLYRVEDGEQVLGFPPTFRFLRPCAPTASDAAQSQPATGHGFDVLEAMKNDPTIEDIPSVVFSSSRMDRDKAKCLALGARGFMTKPSDLDELLEMLRNVCSLVAAA